MFFNTTAIHSGFRDYRVIIFNPMLFFHVYVIMHAVPLEQGGVKSLGQGHNKGSLVVLGFDSWHKALNSNLPVNDPHP